MTDATETKQAEPVVESNVALEVLALLVAALFGYLTASSLAELQPTVMDYLRAIVCAVLAGAASIVFAVCEIGRRVIRALDIGCKLQ